MPHLPFLQEGLYLSGRSNAVPVLDIVKILFCLCAAGVEVIGVSENYGKNDRVFRFEVESFPHSFRWTRFLRKLPPFAIST